MEWKRPHGGGIFRVCSGQGAGMAWGVCFDAVTLPPTLPPWWRLTGPTGRQRLFRSGEAAAAALHKINPAFEVLRYHLERAAEFRRTEFAGGEFSRRVACSNDPFRLFADTLTERNG